MPRSWVPFGGFPQMSGAGNSAVLSRAAPLLLLRERNPFFPRVVPGKEPSAPRGGRAGTTAFPTAGSFKGMGSPTKADIHFCPRVFSSRLFRKFCHDLSALVGPASLPHSLSKETVSSFPCCRVNALRSVKVLSEIGRVLQSGSSPPRNSPSPFVFKESQLLLFFRLLKGQSTLHLHRSSAGRMLRPTSSSLSSAFADKGLRPRERHDLSKVTEQVICEARTPAQVSDSETSAFFWRDLFKPKTAQW